MTRTAILSLAFVAGLSSIASAQGWQTAPQYIQPFNPAPQMPAPYRQGQQFNPYPQPSQTTPYQAMPYRDPPTTTNCVQIGFMWTCNTR